ncbi:hypothetical protein [Streptomyces sp. NPDC001843]|uniref:hypothetical protein n=1 Tax=Streptomyces sp. NPDC001843 TaxID=3364617 RepID=UPI0036B48727
MSGIWRLVKAPELWCADIVRMQRSYEGEQYETEDRDGYTADMPEILEVWRVEDITRNGWITLVQERRPLYGKDYRDRPRYGSLFEETGERIKVRKGAGQHFLLAVSASLEHDDLSICRDRWKRLGAPARPAEYRMPVRRAA